MTLDAQDPEFEDVSPMTFVKKALVLLLLAVLIAPVVGCGVGTTPADHRQAAARVVDYDGRMLIDDLKLFMQIDRPLRNSRWVID